MFRKKYFQIFFDPSEPKGNPNPVEPKEPAPAEPKKESSLDGLDSKELISMIKDLRSEAASNRIKAKELETKLDGIKAKEDKAKEDELKKKGEYEKLLEQKESELNELKSKASAYDEYYNSQVNSIKESMGENWVDDFNKLSLPALQKLSDSFGKKTTVKIDVDDPNKQSKTPITLELTAEDKQRALEMFPARKDEDAYELYKGYKIKQLERKKKET